MTTLAAVRAAVSLEFEISDADLRGPSRRADIVRARHVAMYLARNEAKAPVLKIAAALGRHSFSCVAHGIGATEIRMERDSTLRSRVEKLRGAIRYSQGI
jgi:chromosomal replication initiator protein